MAESYHREAKSELFSSVWSKTFTCKEMEINEKKWTWKIKKLKFEKLINNHCMNIAKRRSSGSLKAEESQKEPKQSGDALSRKKLCTALTKALH